MPCKFTSAIGCPAAKRPGALRAQQPCVQHALASLASQQRRANSRRQEAPIVHHRSASRHTGVARSSPQVNQFVGPAAVASPARPGAHGRGGSLNTSRRGAQGSERQFHRQFFSQGEGGTGRQHRSVRPNPSFELTRYGRPSCLGGIRFANCVPPSQAGLPHRSAQFKR